MNLRRAVAFVTLAWVGATTTSAAAQVSQYQEHSFSVERFLRPPGADVFWNVEGADVAPHLDWWIGASSSLSSRPMVLVDLTDGTEATVPVRTRLGYELSAAIGLGDKAQLGVAMPVVGGQDGDRLRGTDLDDESLAPLAFGDVRLHGKLRLIGKPGAPGRSVAASAYLSLPTGDEQQFAGEKGRIYGWTLIGAWRSRRASLAANLGIRIRSEVVTFLAPSRPHGNEVTGGVAGEVLVPLPGIPRDHLSLVGEYVFARGDTGTNDDVRGPSPHEVRFGGKWRYASGATLGVGAGWGTTPDEVGSPGWRVFATAEFSAGGHARDTDRDGVVDRLDACREDPEDRDGFQDLDGCPDKDNDGDGVPDADDECPNAAEDMDGWRDQDGCPDDQQLTPTGE